MTTQNLPAEYKQLNRLAGKWNTEGIIAGTGTSPEIHIKGTDTYEWLPGGYFLLHTVDVWMGDDRNQTLEIIGFDKDAGHFTMQHYDNKGNSGVMTATVTGERWMFKGDTLQFKGGFSDHDRIFSGVWEQLTEEKTWAHFMDIKLVKAI
jgi:hypothetical protein